MDWKKNNFGGSCRIQITPGCPSLDGEGTCGFPFIHNGQEYNKCITVNRNSPWCKTRVSKIKEKGCLGKATMMLHPVYFWESLISDGERRNCELQQILSNTGFTWGQVPSDYLLFILIILNRTFRNRNSWQWDKSWNKTRLLSRGFLSLLRLLSSNLLWKHLSPCSSPLHLHHQPGCSKVQTETEKEEWRRSRKECQGIKICELLIRHHHLKAIQSACALSIDNNLTQKLIEL